MIVRVASTTAAKVEAVSRALGAIAAVDERFRGATVQPVDVGPIGPAMPMTSGATFAGARARAEAAKAGVALSIGLEGGVEPVAAGGLAVVVWAAATDGARWGFGSGAGIVLPDAIADQVTIGRELGDVVDAIAGERIRGTRGAFGLLTRDLIDRADAFRIAVVAALAPFYNPALYGRHSEEATPRLD